MNRPVTKPTGPSIPWTSTSRGVALLVGGLLTPVAMGLSLALFPVGATMLVYAFAGGVFAFRQPAQGWQWGLWVVGGLLLLTTLTLIGVLLFTSRGFEVFSSNGGFLEVMLLFGLVPAVVGGCLGGTTGSLLAGNRYKRAGLAITVIIVIAAALPFVG